MGAIEDFPDVDLLLANAVSYLIQGDEKEAASLLLQCTGKLYVSVYEKASLTQRGEVRVELTGPRKAHELFGSAWPESEQLWNALRAVLPAGFFLVSVEVRVQTIEVVSANWRSEMQAHLEGKDVTNQGVEIKNREIFLWRGLRFRSQAEVRIAAALDATGVMFLPNCLARLGPKESDTSHGVITQHRLTKEADFLVCHNGKWGVLEVDGSQHEGAAAHDHNRDRVFQQHGIRVTQRYTAKECFNDAPTVVQSFLTLLVKNG